MIDRQQACTEAILQAARQMCLAAQTAPKACGRDSVVSAVLTGEELARLARRMEAVEEEHPGCTPIFRRDAELVEKSADGGRMNEYKTHTRWARKICALAAIYGVKP